MQYTRLRNRRQYFRQRLMITGLLFILGVSVVGFIFSFLVFAWYAKDLPSPGRLSTISGNSTVFYDRDGRILYEMYKDKNRIPVAVGDISTYLKQATIAIEDKNFYRHGGISQLGIIRAAFNVLIYHRLQSGSTITQQLIKNALLTSSQTISRKVREIILASEVERRYTKDQILEMYLNEAPYGGNYWGVGSASYGYFGKQPKDLNLVESAILAGLPQSPSYYSPFIGKNNSWRGRARDVLRRMREDGYIKNQEESVAVKQLDTITFAAPKLAITAPHFIFYVKDHIESMFGPAMLNSGIKIHTTISSDLQNEVEKIVKEEIEKLKGFNATNSAVVILDSKTGEILTMVGSYDYNDEKFGKFNAVLGLRQPGSTVKPITYSLAFEKGYTPGTVVADVKTVFPDQGGREYIPENYDAKFRGPMQLRFALGNSINLVAVKTLAIIGIRDFLTRAYAMGLHDLGPTQENLKKFGLSLTLGGGDTTLLDLTSAYTTFASGGVKRDVSAISTITDYKSKELYKEVRTNEKRLMNPEISFLISHILSDNNARILEFGPNSYLNIPGRTVAVKTGTTDDKRDNWAVGYTKSITVGVWVGNNDNTPMNPKISSGATGASPIFYRIMNTALKKYEDGIIDKPDNVKALNIDAYLGGLPKDGYPTRSEYFIEGSEPKEISPFYKKLKISKANGKLANDMEVRSGAFDEKDFIVITENDPVSTDGKNRWQEGINEWAKGQNDDKFHYPTETSTTNIDDVSVAIKSPADQSKLDSGENIPVKVKIYSEASVKNVKIYVNKGLFKSIDGDNHDINEVIPHLSDGDYQIRIDATNDRDKTGSSTITFGVNKKWDETSPTPAMP